MSPYRTPELRPAHVTRRVWRSWNPVALGFALLAAPCWDYQTLHASPGDLLPCMVFAVLTNVALVVTLPYPELITTAPD